jgi:magnesium transporter
MTMPASADRVAQALTRHFSQLYPDEAAHVLERLSRREITRMLKAVSPAEAAVLVDRLRPDTTAEVFERLGDEAFRRIMPLLEPTRAAAVLARMDRDARTTRLAVLDAHLARELTELMGYPADSAGAIMDPRVTTFRPEATVREAEKRLRALRHKRISDVFVIDRDGRLVGSVPLQELATAESGALLGDLVGRPTASIQATAPQDEVLEVLERSRASSLAVTDFEGRIIGVIRQQALIAAAQNEATADMQTMVGASKDERALSPVSFAVRRRLPWLQINLVTAFLAAAVVGVFEGTIARFTALAVLLPVVAGQSGNTGAQALAVTMRGLALREIRGRHWWRVALKEIGAGAINGIAVATVTGLAVFVWSRSPGLAAVIGTAMVASMAIAGLAGASIPLVLSRLGQDPAQSSSIILTTVTDVVGFLSFLGLATLAAGLL